MGLREPEAGEADELVVDAVGELLVDALAARALDEPRAERLDRLGAPLAAHRAAQPLGLADREPGKRHRHLQHLVLEDDDAERLAQRLGERRVVDRRDEGRVLAQLLPPLDVRVDGPALDRPRPDERDLDRQVVEVLRPRAEQALHLRAALDLEVADGVGALDLGVDGLVVERDAREVDRLAPEARDLVDAVLDRREHPETEQVDLQEPGVGARVLVPLADLPPLHRRRLDGDELDERPGRDHHPARVLRDVARQAADLVRELAERAPAGGGVVAREPRDLLRDAVGVALGDAGEPLELGERQPERLAEVADRAARVVGRERGDEARVLAAVALGDGDDQLLADVAREVEVDVGHGGELAVQEAAEREVGADRVDVREPGQVADDRADRRAPPAARRERMPGRARAAHFDRDLACELEHLPVEQEEARPVSSSPMRASSSRSRSFAARRCGEPS